MATYGRNVPNALTYATRAGNGPVAQRTEHSPPKRGVAGSIPAGLTPSQLLRKAALEPDVAERLWQGIQARLAWIAKYVAAGVPEYAVIIAERRAWRARKLPPSRRAAACEAIGDYMHGAKVRAAKARALS
jgi:hypothetical protein